MLLNRKTKRSQVLIGKKIYIVNFETFETSWMKHQNTTEHFRLCVISVEFLLVRNKILKTQNVFLEMSE